MPTSSYLQQTWVKKETTFDTVIANLATDAVDLRKLDLGPELNFEELVSHIGTASLQGEVEGLRKGTWSAVSDLRPGALGVAPDIGPFLEAAFDTETISGGTSVTYELADGATPKSVQLVRYTGAKLYEVANGAFLTKVTTEIKGKERITMTFEGEYASHGWCFGGAVVTGAHAAGVSVINLVAGDGQRVGVNSLIKFAAFDNSGAGYTVTAVNTDALTITPVLAGGDDLSGGEAVAGVVPSQTLTGTSVGAIACDLSIAGTSVHMISGTTVFETGIVGLDKEATANRFTRLARGPRKFTGNLEVYFLNENNLFLGGAWNGTTRALIQRAGPNTAAARLKINNLAARLDVVPVDIPDADVAMYNISWKARQSAAAADECTFVFD